MAKKRRVKLRAKVPPIQIAHAGGRDETET